MILNRIFTQRLATLASLLLLSSNGVHGQVSEDTAGEAVSESADSINNKGVKKGSKKNESRTEDPMSHMVPLGVGNEEADMDKIIGQIFEKSNQGFSDTIAATLVSAYNTSPDIRAARAELRSVDENIVQAKAGWRPKIDGSLGANLSRQKNSGDTVDRSRHDGKMGQAAVSKNNGGQSASIEARQNLFKGGETLYATRLAKANIKASRAKLLAAEQGVFLSGVQSYLDLLTQYVRVELLRRNEESLKKTLDVTEAKFEVGEETRTGVAQAEGQYAQAVALRITAEAELAAFKATFERVTNRKAGNLARPIVPQGIPITLEEALDRVRLSNPDVIAAQFEERAARHAVDQTQTGLLPQLDLVGSSTAQKDRNRTRYAGAGVAPNLANQWLSDKTVNHKIGLELRVPIYEQGTVRSKTRQASETAEQKRINIEVTRRKVIESVIKAWNDFKQAKESIEYYRIQVKARVASLEGVRQEYAVGSKILLDVLNEMARLVQAQLELIQNEKIYHLAAYQILYHIGDLNSSRLKLNVDHYDPKAHYIEIKNKL